MLCEIASASGSGDASLTSRTTTRVAVAAGPDMHMNCKLPNQRRLPQATQRINHHTLRFSKSNRTVPAFQRWDRSCLGRSRPSSGGVAGPDLQTRTSVFSCSGHFLPGLKAPEHVPGRPVRFTKPGVTHITLPISRNCEFESHDVPTRPIAAATNSKILETTDTATITVQMQKSRINFTRQSLPSTNRRPTVQFSKSTALKTHIRILLCNIKCISRKFDSNFRTDAETHCRFVPSWDGCSPPVPRSPLGIINGRNNDTSTRLRTKRHMFASRGRSTPAFRQKRSKRNTKLKGDLYPGHRATRTTPHALHTAHTFCSLTVLQSYSLAVLQSYTPLEGWLSQPSHMVRGHFYLGLDTHAHSPVRATPGSQGRLPQPFTPPASYWLGRGLRNENDEFERTQVINLRYTLRTQIDTPNRPLAAHIHTHAHKRRESSSTGD